MNPEAVAQPRRVRTGRLKTRQLDGREAILLARIGGQDDAQLVAGFLGPRLYIRIIIALRAQQLLEQVGVGAGAAPDLRRIGGVLALGLERGLLAEMLSRSSAPPIGARPSTCTV